MLGDNVVIEESQLVYGDHTEHLNINKKYISEPDNLKLMMTMLKEKSRNIQFEAFHVFKVRNTSPSLIT